MKFDIGDKVQMYHDRDYFEIAQVYDLDEPYFYIMAKVGTKDLYCAREEDVYEARYYNKKKPDITIGDFHDMILFINGEKLVLKNVRFIVSSIQKLIDEVNNPF